ncbi:MAG: YggN family protein [Candidatus Krumholzibacteria bacterium]|jgi:hypothetical protein|nr:YggN family protein [Candidatus Krumholzibacteria bacterium]
MKRTAVILAIFLMSAFAAANAAPAIKMEGDCGRNVFRGEDISIEFEDDSIILECSDNDDVVEITGDYELYINDDQVKLDVDQRELVGIYYESLDEIIETAKELGIEGARIGAKGAELGLKAVAGAFKVILDDYDSDDLERDMERQARRIEAQAEKLERKGEKLEDMADRFEKTHKKMRRQIRELNDLGWF